MEITANGAPEAALAIVLPENDAEAETVKDYLTELVFRVLVDEESFSGKRPFGNSGWTHDLTGPLEEAGFTWKDEEQLWSALCCAL